MSRKKLVVTVQVEGEPSCPPDVKIGLYRIAQESLNNVVRHSRATAVAVSLRCAGERLALTVADNGRGFDAGQEAADSLGLTFMAERAAGIGATLEIISRAGEGATIRVLWPAATPGNGSEL